MSKSKDHDNVTQHPRASVHVPQSEREPKSSKDDKATEGTCESVLSGAECIDGVTSDATPDTEHVGKPEGSALDSPESMIEGADEAKRKRDRS